MQEFVNFDERICKNTKNRTFAPETRNYPKMSSDIIKHTAQQDCEHACSQSFNTLIADVRQIIENGRKQAYNAVEQAGIATFWNVGRRIVGKKSDGVGEIHHCCG